MTVLILVVAAVFAGYIAPYGYADQDLMAAFEEPSRAHIFGTDEFGRDIFSRIVYGARVSLQVGFIAVGLPCSHSSRSRRRHAEAIDNASEGHGYPALNPLLPPSPSPPPRAAFQPKDRRIFVHSLCLHCARVGTRSAPGVRRRRRRWVVDLRIIISILSQLPCAYHSPVHPGGGHCHPDCGGTVVHRPGNPAPHPRMGRHAFGRQGVYPGLRLHDHLSRACNHDYNTCA